MADALPPSYTLRSEPLSPRDPTFNEVMKAFGLRLADEYMSLFPAGTQFRMQINFEDAGDKRDIAIVTVTTDLTQPGLLITSSLVSIC